MWSIELARGFLSNFAVLLGKWRLHLMKRRRFRRLTTRVVMRMVRAFEASLRQLFGSFLNS
jgi:hypothetical protein